MKKFEKRVYGCAVVKAINSNYNADFTGQPRTLPNGKVYATDKAFKYTVRNYIKCVEPSETVLYFKTLNENMNPISLNEAYTKSFGNMPKVKKPVKGEVARNLLSCIDIRLFGATFAVDKCNISVHGPVQVGHGTNIWSENNIYSEQITAPFSNKSNDADAEKGMTTIGRQSKLEEGHYLHAFSVNPSNLKTIEDCAGDECRVLSTEDMELLKRAMCQGATFYDSASKAGTDNELMVWVELKENSKLVLPSFSGFVVAEEEKKDGKVVYDLTRLARLLTKFKTDVDKVELYYDADMVVLNHAPEARCYELFGAQKQAFTV